MKVPRADAQNYPAPFLACPIVYLHAVVVELISDTSGTRSDALGKV